MLALLITVAGHQAQATYIINISQVGSDVVATGSGTLDTTDLTQNPDSPNNQTGANVLPNDSFDGGGQLVVGPGSNTRVDEYALNIYPPFLGAGGDQTNASSGSGDLVGFDASPEIFVPHGYVSGNALSSTSTWDSTTIDGLGLTPGTYMVTWGSGSDADSITVNVQGPTPEPGTMCLLGVGGAALVLGCLRKRVVRTRIDTSVTVTIAELPEQRAGCGSARPAGRSA